MLSRIILTGIVLTLLMFAIGCDESAPQSAVASTTVNEIPNHPPTEKASPMLTTKPERQPGEFLDRVSPKREARTIRLYCPASMDIPTIDGDASDAAWQNATAITTLDYASQRPITLKAIYNASQVYFLATIPDAAASELHKTWHWDASEEIYKPGLDREDVFVLKWSTVGNAVSLAYHTPQPHTADVWFWKACRTNPVGYIDDKHHVFSNESDGRFVPIKSETYGELYLQRLGDDGQSAYEDTIPIEYEGDYLRRFKYRTPQGSRADVKAKGKWVDGQWTIEFTRVFDTGNNDDLAFEIGKEYLFAASCYEMAATSVNPDFHQPLYRAGDAFDRLILVIE